MTQQFRSPEPPRIKGIVRPPMPMPAALQDRGKLRQIKLPLMITLYAWYCFLRAGINLLLASIVWELPDAQFSAFLAAHFAPVPEPLPPEVAFLLSAVFYAFVGWRWWSRDWRARWYAMFMSGASVAETAANLFGSWAAGQPIPLTGPQQAALALTMALNLLICCYLAFYPGMAQAFDESPGP